jgi:hypothetical protein
VLAALAWLVELLNYDDRAEEAAAAQFDEPARSERQFFGYASTAYRHFLAGDDARAAAADDEMLGQFRERQAALTASNAALQQVRCGSHARAGGAAGVFGRMCLRRETRTVTAALARVCMRPGLSAQRGV